MKTVYTCFCTEVIHEGHLNILREAKQYGKVIVGALSDRALIRCSRFPAIPQEERLRLYRSLDGVDSVVIQDDIRYDDVLSLIRPDYVIHGDNWQTGPEAEIRARLLRSLEALGGQLIEVPYTRNERVSRADRQLREKLAMPEFRRRRLRQLLTLCPVVKAIEAHSGLTGLIAEKTVIAQDGRLDQFDAMWVSSLCDSTAKGKPDIELVDLSSRLRTIDDIMEVTTKPIILDGDTGGLAEHFMYNVRTLERMGVSAVIIEDKTGLKKNSLFGTEAAQTQDSIEGFCAKISAGKRACLTDDFMIIARIESLILEQGMDDALTRARAYDSQPEKGPRRGFSVLRPFPPDGPGHPDRRCAHLLSRRYRGGAGRSRGKHRDLRQPAYPQRLPRHAAHRGRYPAFSPGQGGGRAPAAHPGDHHPD